MRFILYCLCGGVGVSTDFLVFSLLLMLGVGYQVANIAGYIAGTLVSFVLNRKFTFDVRDQTLRRLASFLVVAAIGFLTSAALLWLLIEYFRIDARIAKLMTLPVVVVLQFSLNRWITFRETRRAPLGEQSLQDS